MNGSINPHELFTAFLYDSIGRRAALFGDLADLMLTPLVRGMSDDLSIYLQLRPNARLTVGDVRLREGGERAYIFADIQDRKAPLRLNALFEHWDISLESNRLDDVVNRINGRRWHFAEHELHRFLRPLLTKIGDAMVEYYQRRPYAQPKCGILRWLEGVDATVLCCEIDDRSEATTQDHAPRYRVQ